MMRELRKLKSLLDYMGLRIRSEWIPSVANKFADGLSRRFPRGDLRIRRQLRRSVLDGMAASTDAFPYRPVGEHPVIQKRQAFSELSAAWSKEEVRLLCPPIDLIGPTVHKLQQTKTPAVLLVPDWPRQPWYNPTIRMASKVQQLPCHASEVWVGHRSLNPRWKLLYLELNLDQEAGQHNK